MARDHVVERALEHGQIHRAGDAKHDHDQVPVAERPVVVALVHRQEPFLGEGQGVALRFLIACH
jgi:hypothetical protein